jgi:hypothetical protein
MSRTGAAAKEAVDRSGAAAKEAVDRTTGRK